MIGTRPAEALKINRALTEGSGLAWTTLPELKLTTWPGEQEAIVYLSCSGDVHWLSGPARFVVEVLEGKTLSVVEIHQAISGSVRCDQGDVSGHYIPYLHSLGLIHQIPL